MSYQRLMNASSQLEEHVRFRVWRVFNVSSHGEINRTIQ